MTETQAELEARFFALLSDLDKASRHHQLQAHYQKCAADGGYLGPYPWQVEFHNASSHSSERAIIAANRCLGYDSQVETLQGPVKIGEIDRDVFLWSWNGSEIVPALALKPWLKCYDDCWRVHLSDGSFFDCNGGHAILTPHGYVPWHHLRRFVPNLQGSTLDTCLSTHDANAQRSIEREPDCQSDCPAYLRSHDGRLLADEGSVPSEVPSQDDVQGRIHSCDRKGESDTTQGRSHPYQCSSHPSILDDQDRYVDLCVESLAQAADISCQPYHGRRQSDPLPSPAATSSARLSAEVLQLVDQSVAPSAIVGYEYLGVTPIYATHVPVWNNYLCAGLIHRNTGKTRTGAAEVAIHVTGQYPPWWKGRKFREPTNWIVSGPTNEMVRDVQQKALLGQMVEGQRVPDGTGWIPSDCLGLCGFRQCGVPNVIDTIRVKHTSGEYSYISFKSYEQGAVKFQGVELDGIWLDEEPPLHLDDIFSEARTRLVTKMGLMIFTRTPLFGMSRIVRHFIDGGDGIWYITATWEDSPHLDKKERERYRQTYLDHEVDARTKGVPMLGSGGVYQVPDEQIRCKPFEIPEYFRKICGIDFGIDHPFAAVWIAYDADADIIYVYDCYKEPGQTTSYHAQALKSRGEWIPVSWPHDGMIRDKGGGAALKDQFIDCGVSMLSLSARYDDNRGSGQAREPATNEILDRMRTGRFKVFENLTDWFWEKRMLHREDGKIVARDDDLESATRYAIMMLRYAMSDVEIEETMYDRKPQQDLSYDPLATYSYPRVI